MRIWSRVRDQLNDRVKGKTMKTVGNKQINISEEEYQYYLSLVERFTDEENEVSGKIYFEDTFDTNDDGFIVLIKTEKSLPWAILFFIQQVMLNQRLRLNDAMANEAKKLIKQLEERVNKITGDKDE